MPARASDPPGGASALTFPAWWSAPGGPGWRPEASVVAGTPWTLAGLVAGSWELDDPLAPTALPDPGIFSAQVPLAWYDSASVVTGEGAAWRGYGAGLAVAKGWMKPPDGGKPRAMFVAMSGAHGLDRNGVLITRGDPANWLRVGAIAGRRGGVGALGIAGDHLWTITAGRSLGAHAFDAGFVQRGMGETQRVGESQSGRGQNGTLGWSWRNVQGDSLGARYARGFDTHVLGTVALEAAGNQVLGGRRDANARTLEFVAHRQRGALGYGARVEHRVSRVAQWIDLGSGEHALVGWRDENAWFAAEHTRPLGEGVLQLTLGAGHDAAPALAADRTVIAPAIAWHVDQARQGVRVFFERIVDPVWSDLAHPVLPFLQHTWAGGFSADVGRGAPAHGRVELVAGRTANRATVYRSPVPAAGEILGVRADAHRYNFLLVQSSAAATWRTLAFDAGGFALARGHSADQSRVDPALGGRAGLGSAFTLFSGDLGVRLRVEAAYVGVRETDLRYAEDRLLPGYGTYSATASMTLGDATIVIRGDGLEGVRHPLTWLDFSTGDGSAPALDAGRQFRAEVSWPLFN